jgi:ornithine cyclodeaminase/alanine dehydrogenase
MALLLSYETMQGVLGMRDAIDLLERAALHEAAGRTVVSPRLNSSFDNGWMRILFAADYTSGYCATKAYHMVAGAGVRYIVTLYRLDDGEPVALLDGRLITDLRTGAASGVIARKVPVGGTVSVGIIGAGNQARAQLASLATVYDIKSAMVFSPTPARRVAFAREMSEELGIAIAATDNAYAAVHGCTVVATASSAQAKEPVLRGEWLADCRLLCAVGNTRPQFAEADVACFGGAELVVMDSTNALEETGELKQAVAAGALPEAKRATLAEVVSGAKAVPVAGRIAFKSVGTALQDLALAVRFYEILRTRPGLPQAPALASLRPK